MLAAGTRISRYQIVEPLGAGGMGEVYVAQDATLGRRLALKLLPAGATGDEDRMRRFELEARAASALNHPNIVTIHELGWSAAGHFIAMELVQGRTLREMAHAPCAVETVAEIGRQIAEALGVAHAAGITHRDIKPENIMVREDGYVKVLDFGLARLVSDEALERDATTAVHTIAGNLLGTVRYMSPEQARGEAVTSATDLFSLGLVLYELATGQHAFDADSPVQLLHAIVSDPAVPPSRLNPELPPALDMLLLQLLEKDAPLRPTALDAKRALAGIGDTRPRGRVSRQEPAANQPATVGREKERDQLRAGFEEVQTGRGLILTVSAEAGGGKTTVVEAFLTDLAAGDEACRIARGRCSERLAGTEAYLPWLDALGSLLHDAAAGSIARTMKGVAPTWYLQLAPVAPGDSADARLRAEGLAASQERLKRELAALLQEVSRIQPLVVFLDDVHWADAATIDLLSFLADRLDRMRLLVIATYRPSELLLTKHPFAQLRQGLAARGVCRDIALALLTRDDVDRYLALKFPQHRFPPDLPARLHARTEGNPLFVTDLVRYLCDRHAIAEGDGGWMLAYSLPEIDRDLPESVRGMIERKMAQLTEDDRRLLAAASVQGYEFDSAVLAQALSLDPAVVEERLDEADRAHAFVRMVEEREFPDGTLSLRYRFVHVLYQNALYDGLRPTRRAQLAAATARALERCSGQESAAVANELALLFEVARDFGRAADCFRLAAQQALKLFASREAVALARRGLAMVNLLPAGRDRMERELSILIVLGNALIATGGYSAPEVEQSYARAGELCRELGDTPHLLPALWGANAFNIMRARHRRTLELGQEFLALAERRHDPAIVVALRVIGQAFLFTGQLSRAREQFERLVSIYDPARHRPLTWLYAQEPGMAGHALLGLTLWLLGYPDQALAHNDEALRLGREAPQHNSQANALVWAGIHHQFRREWSRVGELAEAVMALATEQGLRFWLTIGAEQHGSALVELGPVADGGETLRRGIAGYQAAGAILMQTHLLSLLASACGKAGQPREGLATLQQVRELIASNGESFWEAEVLRLTGDLLKMDGAAAADVESSYQQAIDTARRQQAKSLELRATTSLARSWQQHDRCAEGRTRLAAVYEWFTEGFETVDLREARTLLDELS